MIFSAAQKIFFIIVGVVLGGISLFSAAALLRRDVRPSEYATAGVPAGGFALEGARTQTSPTPFFVFDSRSESNSESGRSGEKMELIVPALPEPTQPANLSSPTSSIPANVFRRITDAIPRFLILRQKKTPTLPVVLESDLALSSTGIRDITGYMERLATQYRSISFDYTKLNETLRVGDTQYPSVQELVDAALRAKDISDYGASVGILREFAQAKIAFEKMIPVTDSGISVSKTVVGMDMLTVQLIDAFQELRSGAMARNDFEDFYARYKDTETFYANKLLQEAGVVAVNPQSNIFVRMMEFLGLGTVTHAQLSVGGPVILQTICTCSFGGAITVGPPAGGNFFIPPVFALFPNFSPDIGHFVLGLYSPVPIPCLQFEVVACIPDPLIPGTQGTVIMLGTS